MTKLINKSQSASQAPKTEAKAEAKKAEGKDKGNGGSKPKLSRKDKVQIKTGRLFNSLVKLDGKAKRAGAPEDVLAAFVAAEKAVEVVKAAITGSGDWKRPEKEEKAEILVQKGSKVALREKYADKYEAFIPKGSKLEVVEVGKAILRVKLPNGSQGFVARKEVLADGETERAPKAEKGEKPATAATAS